MVPGPKSVLIHQEFKGPLGYSHWRQGWGVFAAGTVMADAVTTPHLVGYGDMIMRYDHMYGPKCWAFLYQQDTRLRREHMPRMRRRESEELNDALARNQRTAFNADKPYDYPFSLEEARWWYV